MKSPKEVTMKNSKSVLAEILRHDRVVVETGEHGTVEYVDDQIALVVIDGGYERTCKLGEIELAGQ
jgi:preprotein translocase subunit YajC